MKNKKGILKRIYLCGAVLILGIINNPVLAQIPAGLENDMYDVNAMIYKALKIIDTEPEQQALKQLASFKPKIEAKVKAYTYKWKDTELSEEDEIRLGKKILEKQLYKDMISLTANPEFINKLERSPALKKEYNIIMNYLDEEEEKMTTSVPVSGSSVLSFTVSGAVPFAGNYTVKGNSEQAFAYIDENNMFVVDITSTLNGGEFLFTALAEEAKTGTHKWTMDSQIILQSWDDEQNEVIQLSGYEYEGSVTFDKIEKIGGKVTGSFKGKFYDDTYATDQPVNVSGSFSVTRMKNAY